MTTNLGSKIIEEESGVKNQSKKDRAFQVMPDAIYGWEPRPEPALDPSVFERITELVNDELKNFFRPEFLNRIDEIIVFSHLSRFQIWQICGLMIKQLATRLKEKDIILEVDQAVQAFLSDEGFDPLYGARPLRRAIMKYLEDDLANNVYRKLYILILKLLFVEKKQMIYLIVLQMNLQ